MQLRAALSAGVEAVVGSGRLAAAACLADSLSHSSMVVGVAAKARVERADAVHSVVVVVVVVAARSVVVTAASKEVAEAAHGGGQRVQMRIHGRRAA